MQVLLDPKQVQIETLNHETKKIVVTFEATQCQTVQQSILKKAQANITLPGFRKGKVPAQLIQSRYGKDLQANFQQELYQQTLEYLKAHEKGTLAAVKKVDFAEKDAGQILTMEVEWMDQLPPVNWSAFSLEPKNIQATDEDVANFIDHLRKQSATYTIVDRPIRSKDYVKLSYEGFLGEKPLEDYDDLPHLWCKQSGTWEEADGTDRMCIPEIAAGLKGLKKGDETDIRVHCPEDFPVEPLRNQEVRYHVVILEVREVKLPAQDAAFYQKWNVKDAEDLKARAAKSICQQKESAFDARQKQRIAEFLIAQNTADLPPTWMKNMTDAVLQEMVNVFSEHGVKESDMEAQKQALHQKAQALARDRLKLNVYLEKIFKDHQLKLEASDFNPIIVQEAQKAHITPQKLLQNMQTDESLKAHIQTLAFQTKTLQWIYNDLTAKNSTNKAAS